MALDTSKLSDKSREFQEMDFTSQVYHYFVEYPATPNTPFFKK
jgi:hypothetical protein